MNKNILGASLIGTGSLVAGFAVGYFVAKTRMEALMELQLKEEIASVKAAFNRGQKATMFGTLESESAAERNPQEQGDFLAGKVGEQAKAEFIAKYVTPFESREGVSDDERFDLDEDQSVKSGSVNIFDQAPILVAGYPNPDDTNAPYLITIDQFHEENDHYDKNSIVYYAGDLVLADETEAEIHDIPNTVAADFMDHFGEMSGDENIVYYRNDRLSIDFEISRDSRTYAEQVLGLIPGIDDDSEPEIFVKTPRKPRTRVRDDRDD